MSDRQYYTISELAEAADTTPRTIRYYTTEGLLPSPDTRGRYALYGTDHLVRLRLIARLKEAYLPLHEIRTRIAPLSTEQVQQLLNEGDEPEPSSAADYLTQVLSGPHPATPPAPRPSMLLREEPQVYTSAPQPGAVDESSVPRRSMLSRLAPPRPPQFSEDQHAAGESWRRIVLAPGVELHVREPLTPEAQEQIEQLIATAHKLFE